MKERKSVYETVTNSIISELEQGAVPWIKPWTAKGNATLPHNAVTNRQYGGINILLLWGVAAKHGYQNSGWLTFKQAQSLGGHIRKGEKGSGIVYMAKTTKKEIDQKTGVEAEKEIPFLRWYTVFNIEQTEDLPEEQYAVQQPPPFEEMIPHVEAFIAAIGATIRHGTAEACYRPATDTIDLPYPGTFHTPSDYYATSLHEHVHYTAPPTRLDRDLSGRFKSESYAAEELVAELGAAFLCATLGVPGKLRHSGYIASWLELLKHDSKAIFTAARKATEAAEYLHAQAGRHSSAQ